MTATTDRVVIFDTTLRDGEQCPGATMTYEEKLEVADCLDALGVDIIEAGFPIASEGDFDAVSAIAKRVQNATVAGLARAINADIDRAGEAVRHAKRGRIHTFVSTSPIHLEYQMRKSAGRGAGDHHGDGGAGAQPGGRRRMVGDGRDADADRLSVPVRGCSDQGRCDDDQPAGYGRIRDAAGILRDVQGRARARAECGQGDLFDPLPQRSGVGGGQFAGGAWRRVRGRSNAR